MREAGVEVLRPLGSGSEAKTFAARDLATGRPCLLKLVRPAARSSLEGEVLGAVVSPHIPRLWRTVELADGHALVIDLAPGGPLSEHLESGPLSLGSALALVTAASRGLAAVHRAGFLHLDVKPANLVVELGSPASACVVDFGLARRAPCVADEHFSGTPAYAAPEQLRRGFALERATDIYGLGCVLFHALTGAPPFAGKTRVELQAQHLRAEIPSAGSGAGIDELLRGMLAKRSDERYQAMEEIEAAIGSL